jgi:hypothetical protein
LRQVSFNTFAYAHACLFIARQPWQFSRCFALRRRTNWCIERYAANIAGRGNHIQCKLFLYYSHSRFVGFFSLAAFYL